MNQDITLNINSHVLERAVIYARMKGTDLSGLVESLLKKATKEKKIERIHSIEELDPRIQQLVGVVHFDDEVGLNGEISKESIPRHQYCNRHNRCQTTLLYIGR